MSSHYTLYIRVGLKIDVSIEDMDCLNYIIIGGQYETENWPDHPYFETAKHSKPLPSIYEDFQHGSFVSSIWNESNPGKGITRVIPSIKSDDNFWEMLLLIYWLCSFSAKDGFVGTISND